MLVAVVVDDEARLPQESGRSLAVGVLAEPGSRKSPGGVFLQSRLKVKSDTRRSPDSLPTVDVEDGARLP